MYVCLCLGITDQDIRQTVAAGANSVKQVREQLGAGSQCGKCAMQTRQLVRSELEVQQQSTSALTALFYEAS